MSTQPAWEAVDSDTGDLLTLLADDGTVSTDYEWGLFVDCLRDVGISAWRHGDGIDCIDPNRLRSAIAGRIKPFTHRALSQGLVEYTGRYVTSTDRRGRNSGKPCRELRWVGGAA